MIISEVRVRQLIQGRLIKLLEEKSDGGQIDFEKIMLRIQRELSLKALKLKLSDWKENYNQRICDDNLQIDALILIGIRGVLKNVIKKSLNKGDRWVQYADNLNKYVTDISGVLDENISEQQWKKGESLLYNLIKYWMKNDEVHERRDGVAATLHIMVYQIWKVAQLIHDNSDLNSFQVGSNVNSLIEYHLKEDISMRGRKNMHNFYQNFKSLAASTSENVGVENWKGSEKYVQITIDDKNYKMSKRMSEFINRVYNELPKDIKKKINSSKNVYDQMMLKLLQAVDKKGGKDLTYAEILEVINHNFGKGQSENVDEDEPDVLEKSQWRKNDGNKDEDVLTADDIIAKDKDVMKVFHALKDRRYSKREQILLKVKNNYEAILEKGEQGKYDNLNMSDRKTLHNTIRTYYKLLTGFGHELNAPEWGGKIFL